MEATSYETEARFVLRKSFAMYGEHTLLMCLHLTALTDEEFFRRYKTTKEIVQEKMMQLELAVERRDFATRNSIYDFFIEVL